MAALSAQTTQASGRVPGGPLVGLSGRIAVGRTSCDATALALENARLEAELRATTDELRRSRVRIVTAAAAERHRLERELHDGAQNRLVALQIRLGIAQEQAEAPDVARLLSELGDQAEAVGEELRRIARGIYPSLLATFGLAEALTAEARLSGVAVQILASRVGSSTPEVELAVYLCCLEAIQNAAKHAGRDARVAVRLSHDEDELTFSVQDDGCGFQPASAKGSGLAGMEDRIAALGGRLQVSSTRGHGTAVAGWSRGRRGQRTPRSARRRRQLSSQMDDYKDLLRRLALRDHELLGAILGDESSREESGLDARTHALVRLSTTVAVNAGQSCCQHAVERALAAGATTDEIVGTLIAIVTLTGVPRAVAAAPRIGLALGYDVDSALEGLDT